MKQKIVNTSATVALEQLISELGEMFTEINTAFTQRRLSLKYKQATDDSAKQIRKCLVTLTETTDELSGAEALAIQGTTINLSKVFYDVLRLTGHVESKIKDKVLFSEEAMAEMSGLLKRSSDLLPHVADALRTCNELIAKHVEKEVEELRSFAASSTLTHEDRLCKNVCHPKASVIYLQMLQHIQDILWHFKALACHNGISLQ
ncbi:MAG: hypothetical protein KGZ41_06185 [Dethiobacter sp.]|jgi:Na+/phosphate symporter|nr:hypothetical protein [Dethiobacter sp.]MCL4463524.1 hypothetical protein [Bacillota bacterium]MCL5994196.1 hypothetical protein [Bacillota bacterium]